MPTHRLNTNFYSFPPYDGKILDLPSGPQVYFYLSLYVTEKVFSTRMINLHPFLFISVRDGEGPVPPVSIDTKFLFIPVCDGKAFPSL